MVNKISKFNNVSRVYLKCNTERCFKTLCHFSYEGGNITLIITDDASSIGIVFSTFINAYKPIEKIRLKLEDGVDFTLSIKGVVAKYTTSMDGKAYMSLHIKTSTKYFKSAFYEKSNVEFQIN